MNDLYLFTGKAYLGDMKWEKIVPSRGQSFSFENFDHINNIKSLDDIPEGTIKEHYIIPSSMSGSDYSGGTVQKSNYRTFLRLHKNQVGIHAVYGGYETYGVAIRVDRLDKGDIQEHLNEMEEYVLDDQDLSNLESELSNKAWDRYAREELQTVLRNIPGMESVRVGPKFDANFIYPAMQEANVDYVFETGCKCYLNIDTLVPYIADIYLAEKTKARDLPLLLGREWKSMEARDVFEKRLKCEQSSPRTP